MVREIGQHANPIVQMLSNLESVLLLFKFSSYQTLIFVDFTHYD